jgi:hypothetical protein
VERASEQEGALLRQKRAGSRRLSWASASEKKREKRALLISVFGLSRRRRGCRYPYLVGSLEEEGAAATRISWARAKKKGLPLPVSRGLARRRRGCCYQSLMASLEEEGAAAFSLSWPRSKKKKKGCCGCCSSAESRKRAVSRAVGGDPLP